MTDKTRTATKREARVAKARAARETKRNERARQADKIARALLGAFYVER